MSEEAQRMQYIGEQDLREYPADGPTNRQLRKPRWTRWRKIETRLQARPHLRYRCCGVSLEPGEWCGGVEPRQLRLRQRIHIYICSLL